MRSGWTVRVVVALASVGALLAFLASGPARAQETVKVGLPVPLTGFVAESAREMVEGFQLYLEESGQKLGGLPVQVVIEDTEAQPQNALTKLRKLVEQDKVAFVVGYLLAFEGYAVRDYVHRNKVPLFLPIVAADDLTQRQRSPYIVRMTWTSSQPNHPLGEYAFKTLKYRRMATVGQDYAFGWENVGGFHRTFEQAGGKIVQKTWAPIGTTDYAPYIAKIQRDVDAVYALLVGSDIPRFVKQYEEFGLKGKNPADRGQHPHRRGRARPHGRRGGGRDHLPHVRRHAQAGGEPEVRGGVPGKVQEGPLLLRRRHVHRGAVAGPGSQGGRLGP